MDHAPLHTSLAPIVPAVYNPNSHVLKGQSPVTELSLSFRCFRTLFSSTSFCPKLLFIPRNHVNKHATSWKWLELKWLYIYQQVFMNLPAPGTKYLGALAPRGPGGDPRAPWELPDAEGLGVPFSGYPATASAPAGCQLPLGTPSRDGGPHPNVYPSTLSFFQDH